MQIAALWQQNFKVPVDELDKDINKDINNNFSELVEKIENNFFNTKIIIIEFLR